MRLFKKVKILFYIPLPKDVRQNNKHPMILRQKALTPSLRLLRILFFIFLACHYKIYYSHFTKCDLAKKRD
ncbi:MAG: hypothetical protein OXC40_06940 [Proteobacteria bacterium]|nr:hypothetical protein [Pseudomonadota bacterium]